MRQLFRPLFRPGRLRRAVLALVAAPALTVAMFALPLATPTADAFSCASGDLCTWQNSGESGTQWNYRPNSGQPAGYWWYVGSGANDQISSIHNAYKYRALVAKNCPADAQNTYLTPGGTASNLANNKWPNGTGMNDSISAWGVVLLSYDTTLAHGARPQGGC